MPKLADIYNCSGCLSCVESCPKDALFSRWNEEGHLTYGINQDLCIECHKCEKNCPALNGFAYGNNVLSLSTPYAAWTNDIKLRSHSTSGGVFAALAVCVLNQGGVVVGALIQDNYVKHKLISSIDDLPSLQGSKYTQSDTTGVFREVLKYLKEGKLVLFSGLGCQVAGLINFLPKGKKYSNLITVDLICGGVPSRALITKYIENKSDDVYQIVAFRNKTKYEFSIKDSKGDISAVPLIKRPLPLCGFYTELTNKYICYDCKYVGAHRESDITIGDYWGDTEFTEQHSMGVSVTVAHSEIGGKILKDADLFLKEIPWNTFLLHNTRMVYGQNGNSLTSRRKQLADSINKDSYSKFVIKYANGATIKQPVQFAIKVIRYLYGRVRPNYRIAFVKELLEKEIQ